jgi:hypothetical protein
MFGDLADKLDPALVSPVVAYLASEECSVTGEIYSIVGGRVARVFLGVTPGYFNPDLTAEDVRDHLAEVRAEEGYAVPVDGNDEIARVAPLLRAAT